MVTSNLWKKARIVNDALGYIRKIISKLGNSPHDLPTYVMVEFDHFIGCSLEGKVISIIPIERSRTHQLPL